MVSFICYVMFCSLGHGDTCGVSVDHHRLPGFYSEARCISVHGLLATFLLIPLPQMPAGGRKSRQTLSITKGQLPKSTAEDNPHWYCSSLTGIGSQVPGIG